MKKRVYVQRQVQVWIEEKYDIENDDQETLEDLGKVDILNSDGVVIYSNYNDV